MLLRELFPPSVASLAHLENYVNDGSPSGYSPTQQLPPEIAPGSTSLVELPTFVVPEEKLVIVGSVDEYLTLCDKLDGLPILLHPADNTTIPPKTWTKAPSLKAYRTASGRTFILAEDDIPPYHAKLHYPGMLGRVNRHLPFHKAVAGNEVAAELALFLVLHSGVDWAMLREPTVVAIQGSEDRPDTESKDVCFILRSHEPYPSINAHNLALIPSFSLFGHDAHRPQDDTLIAQILHSAGVSWRRFLDMFVIATLRYYWTMVASLGLMPELNAQNLLFEVSRDLSVVRPVFRDMSRVEKLMHVRRRQGRTMEFVSGQYKVVDFDEDPDTARTRHGFSFDFKLSQYIIKPILLEVSRCTHTPFDIVLSYCREANLLILRELELIRWLPERTITWAHDRVVLTGERRYINAGPALLR